MESEFKQQVSQQCPPEGADLCITKQGTSSTASWLHKILTPGTCSFLSLTIRVQCTFEYSMLSKVTF